MFGLFKRTKIEKWEMDVLKNTIMKLPSEYKHLIKQIDDGLFKGVIIPKGTITGYVVLTYNPKIAKVFENKKDRNYKLTDINVLDTKSSKYLIYTIYVSTGRINGYSVNTSEKFNLDVDSVDVGKFKKVYSDNVDYKKIEGHLNSFEKSSINSNEVYEVLLNDKVCFHIKDLDDGDFIGMDYEKNIYKITHDPFEIVVLDGSLQDILKE